MPTTGLVLLYHRVASLDSDPQLLTVSPENFARQLQILGERYRPMPLSELTEGARRGDLPEGAVAVTFDDGYADNLETAQPLLEQYGISATVFLTTSYVGGGREFWWDDLERLLLLPGRMPPMLQLHVGRKVERWELGAATTYDADAARRHRGWNVENRDNPTPRHQVYRSLARALRSLSSVERDATLQELSRAVDAPQGTRSTHRALGPDEVIRLVKAGVFDVGAHTATHPALSALSPAAQQSEIEDSKAEVQKLAGREVDSFAYPFGGRSDYTRATVGLVRDAGFATSYSTHHGLVGPRSDPFQLPRMLIRDWDSEAFSLRLRACLDAER